MRFFSSLDLFTSLKSDVLTMFGQRGVNINQVIEQTNVVQICCRKAIRIAAPHATVRSHRGAVDSSYKRVKGRSHTVRSSPLCGKSPVTLKTLSAMVTFVAGSTCWTRGPGEVQDHR